MRSPVPIVLCALLSAQAAAQQNPGTVRAGEHFRVVCYFENPRVAELALETAEKTWPLAAEVYGVAAPPESPYTIHLFRDATRYHEAESRVTGGRFRNNLAFTSWRHREAFLALQPECSAATLEAIGLPPLTRRLIAHEATHLVCYQSQQSYREHPEWFSEGLASYVADEVMRANGWSRGREAEPLTATDFCTLLHLRETLTFPSLSQILAGDLPILSESQRYAVYWSFVDYLMQGERSPAFRDVLVASRALRRDGFEAELQSLFLARIAPDGSEELWQGFGAHLSAMRPDWRVESRSLASFGADWLQTAFSWTDAAAWSAQSLGDGEFAIVGTAHLLPGDRTPQARVLLGQNPEVSAAGRQENVLYVELHAGYGVRVRQLQDVQQAGRRIHGTLALAKQRVRAVTEGVDVPFRVTVDGDRLVVSIAGEDVLEHAISRSRLTGSFGLGAAEGTSVFWRGLSIERR